MFLFAVAALLVPIVAFALFTNGGFESGDFTGWVKSNYYNPGLSGTAPFTGANIVRSNGGTDESVVVTAPAPETGVDPLLGPTATLKYPKYGTKAARVNGPNTGAVGNTIRQQTTVTAADVDPLDQQIHIRFVYAPVMENPQHAAPQQPYYFVKATNVTRSTTLYESLRFSNEAGVPWKQSPLNSTYLYTDWQVVDIAPGSANIAVGDTVEIEVTAVDCSPGAHFGYVYVDGLGSFIPGLSVVATETGHGGGVIRYHFLYRNTGSTDATGVIVRATVPPNTTFSSMQNGSGSNCTESGGVITCNVGALAQGASGSFDLTVNVMPGNTAVVNLGNYSIEATGVTPTLGPLVSVDAAADPAAIPTLSQYALLALALTLAAYGAYRLL
jgi:uncharacterized repeat protein (TIGR01451 family)